MSDTDHFFDQFRHDNDLACLNRALYMNTSFPIPGIAMFFLSIVVISLTSYIRWITPGVRYVPFFNNLERVPSKNYDPLAPGGITEGGTGHQVGETSVEENEMPEQGENPPPYQENSEVTRKMKAPKPRTSAESFVLGTFLLSIIIFCLVTIALATQATIFCQDWSPLSAGPQLMLWFFYLSPLLTSTWAFGCWMMLLRDLWGRVARKQLPVSENWFFLPFGMVGSGLALAVEGCQRQFCGGGIEAEDRECEDVVDLEEGPGGNRKEENIGLISGIGS